MRYISVFLWGLFFIYGDANAQVDTMGNSFYNVYNRVLSASCAKSACHDGSFEPDFRTLTSAYYTLVYQPVTKNNKSTLFTYRVVPFDTGLSLLYQRITNCCFVNDNDRMPLDGAYLTATETELINKWIMAGAKDFSGQTGKVVVARPSVSYAYYAFNTDGYPLHPDTNRVDKRNFKPFIIPASTKKIRLVFFISNVLPENTTVQLQISKSAGLSLNVANVDLKFKDNSWTADFDVSALEGQKTYYMQLVYTNTTSGVKVSYPNSQTEYYIRDNWSFITQ